MRFQFFPRCSVGCNDRNTASERLGYPKSKVLGMTWQNEKIHSPIQFPLRFTLDRPNELKTVLDFHLPALSFQFFDMPIFLGPGDHNAPCGPPLSPRRGRIIASLFHVRA